MVFDIIRDSTVGHLVNRASHGRLFAFADQRPDYVVPARYLPSSTPRTPDSDASTLCGDASSKGAKLSKTPSLASFTTAVGDAEREKASDLEAAQAKAAVESAAPTAEAADPFIVIWDGDDDQENPRNWSFWKRAFVAFNISLLTFSIYIGSAIYTPSIPGIMAEFNVSLVQATLGLTLYVMAYGIGPMFLAPLQEMPAFGRNPVYILGLFAFVLFNVPIVVSNKFSVILAFRFLTGFVGSPALATGGASMGDIFPPAQMAYVIAIWALGAVAGPILGPVIGGFAAMNAGWRWTIYELLMISGFATIFLAVLLPETYEPTILLNKARRLRKLTGNDKLRSQSEIDAAKVKPSDHLYEALVRPFVLAFEPALLFANVYLGFVYALFYTWFESFPLVFTEIYHFNLGLSGLPFLAFIVSASITFTFYVLYQKYHLIPRSERANGQLAPEVRLELGIAASIFIPISMLIFGFTSRPSIHWIVPVIGAGLYLPGIFLNFQSILLYVSFSYPAYAASVLAGNDFFRSVIASVFPLFGGALFKNLGLGPGSALLAGLSVAMLPFFFLLYKYGHVLRARSKYASA